MRFRSSVVTSPLGLVTLLVCLALGFAGGVRVNEYVRDAWFAIPALTPRAEAAAVPPTLAAILPTIAPPTPIPATPTPYPTLVLGDQVNLLILGVDGLDLPAPSLKAVWIALLQTQYKQVYLLGLSPDLLVTTTSQGVVRLREAYAMDPGAGAGGPRFQEALAAISPPPPPMAGTLVVDTPLLADIVDRIGGVEINSVQLDGANALAYVAMMREPTDPLDELDRQGEFLDALRQAASDASLADPLPFAQLLAERGRCTLAPGTLAALAQAFAGYDLEDAIIQARPGDKFTVLVGEDGTPAVALAQPTTLP